MAYRTTGNTIAEWDDSDPFTFTMSEQSGPQDARVMRSHTLDLSRLRTSYEDSFLIHLKEHLIDRRDRVSLATVHNEATVLVMLLERVMKLGVFDDRVGVIDEPFLLCLATVQEHIPATYLAALVRVFRANPSSPMFAKGLSDSDFPQAKTKRGRHGDQIHRILAKALSQAAVANILDLCDTAYAAGKLDIGLYSYVHLAFAVFCRPNSYRQIRVSDLHCGDKSRKYTIRIVASKSGEQDPSKTNFRINEPLGVLLTKQRQHVIATYGHLVAPTDIDKLALFPARKLKVDKSRWLHGYANQSWGMYESSGSFVTGYGLQIEKTLGENSCSLSANALRHTVGTLLAQTGASAKTIQAVLRHATDSVCAAYVDIAFHGLVEELSEALRPAFEAHLPGLLNFRSKADPIAAEKRIWSKELETGQFEDIGECGKSIACEHAPIVCYGCFRFRPFWDVDHSVNLAKAEKEIDDMERRGKPFEHMVRRARTAKNRIIVVMNAADRYLDALPQERI